jgi:hypothetical protein
VFTFRDSTDGLAIKCNTVTAVAMVAGTGGTSFTTETITYTDHCEMDKCRDPVGTTAKIDMNGCQYKSTPGTQWTQI